MMLASTLKLRNVSNPEEMHISFVISYRRSRSPPKCNGFLEAHDSLFPDTPSDRKEEAVMWGPFALGRVSGVQGGEAEEGDPSFPVCGWCLMGAPLFINTWLHT